MRSNEPAGKYLLKSAQRREGSSAAEVSDCRRVPPMHEHVDSRHPRHSIVDLSSPHPPRELPDVVAVLGDSSKRSNEESTASCRRIAHRITWFRITKRDHEVHDVPRREELLILVLLECVPKDLLVASPLMT